MKNIKKLKKFLRIHSFLQLVEITFIGITTNKKYIMKLKSSIDTPIFTIY